MGISADLTFHKGIECKTQSYRIEAGKLSDITMPLCIFKISEINEGILDVDLGTIKKFSKRNFVRITLFPRDNHIGNHQVTATIRDKLKYMQIGQAFKFLVQVVPPIKHPDFTCPLGRKVRCLPRIIEISPKGVMLVKFPLGLPSINETQYQNINQALFLDLADPEEED